MKNVKKKVFYIYANLCLNNSCHYCNPHLLPCFLNKGCL